MSGDLSAVQHRAEIARIGEQLALPLSDVRVVTRGRIWLLAADWSDVDQIIDYLAAGDGQTQSGFFISVMDGSHAVRPGDVLALRQGAELRVFLAGDQAPTTQDEDLRRGIRETLQANDGSASATGAAGEFLFVRLAGNGQPLAGRDADGVLARALRLLQEADQEAEARFIAETAGYMLEQMPDGPAGAIEGILQRLRAGALFSLCRSIYGFSSEMLVEAVNLYRQAAGSFEQANLHAQTTACLRYAKLIGDLARRNSGEEPFLPGIGSDPGIEPAIPRLAFRALRCLAIPIGGEDAQEPGASAAIGFRDLGFLKIGESQLRRLIDEVTSRNVVPRIAVSHAANRDRARRVKVDFDREHFALLGIKDRRMDEARFSVFVQGDGWAVSPPVHFTGPGRSATFVARARSATATPLRVLIAAGADLGTFDVPL